MKTDDNRVNEVIATATKLVSNDNKSFKLRLCYVFLEDTKYMTILTRQERERLVLDLYYNQGKTYREISKVARISPRDIGVILNKAIEEKAEGSKKNKILLIQTTTIRKMNNAYLYLLKHTNSFPIERLH